MLLSVRQIIFVAISNYLSASQLEEVRKEIGRKIRWSPLAFIKVFQQHIDLELLRTKPFFKEDILIYNYLMYDAIHKENVVFSFNKIGEKKMKFYISATIRNYEKQIILPQINALKEAKLILEGLVD
jgi:hypothetical protein